MEMSELSEFISKYVTKRETSMFLKDIDDNREVLSKHITGKSVLVIGGAGSIGSSFIKALLPFRPDKLVIVDTNENALTELTRDLRSSADMFVPDTYITYPFDYNSGVFSKMFKKNRGFDIVANFSAHKHVRSEKDIFSIEAMLRNNIINADRLLRLLDEYRPELYFCVSTDKAANPVNIMGAGKRIMEDLIFSYSESFPVKTARFANVAFSNGSLPDGFLRRIEKKQPLSAPTDVKRYFVSPEESGQICLLSAMLADNREILFPKLDEAAMMSFDTIATALLKEKGYVPRVCKSEAEAIELSTSLHKDSREYPVFFSASDTSGEKAFEEFYTGTELIDLERFNALGVIIKKPIPDRKAIDSLIKKLEQIFDRDFPDKSDVIGVLYDYLPDFRHIETGRCLDSKM